MPEEPERVERGSPDLAAEELAKLEKLFPGVVSDGVLDAARIGEAVGLEVSGLKDGRERYGLMWAGKQEAVQSLLSPSRGTLNPDVAASVEFDSAGNVFVQGDNLEVLKLMQKSYNDQVKLIYIDPPYNTGNDFVYNDDFSDGLRAYLEYTGQLDADGNRTSASVDTSGRKHSRWMTMMYPRLVLARNLLRQDGFFFASISDTEGPALRLMCDEIFGEENFIEAFVWHSIFRPSNMSKRVRRNAEYVLCYRRNAAEDFELVERIQDPQGEASFTQNNNSVRTLSFPAGTMDVKLPDGRYGRGTFGDIKLVDDLVVSDGRLGEDVRIAGRFKWSQDYLDKEIGKGVYLVVKTKTFIPYFRKDYQQTKLRPTKILPRDLVGDVLQANAEVEGILGVPGIFDYPKPTSLVRFLMRMVGVAHNDLILDFFAGSGTTAHAVMLENEVDGGTRRCLSVNIPEPTDEGSPAHEAGYATVADITRARINSAMASVEGAERLGLRTYDLGESHFRDSDDAAPDDLLSLAANTLKHDDATDNQLAAEILIREGVRLDAAWTRTTAGGANVVVADGVAVVLAPEVTEPVVDDISALAPRVVVFLEDAFAGADAVKANAFYAYQQAGITMKTA